MIAVELQADKKTRLADVLVMTTTRPWTSRQDHRGAPQRDSRASSTGAHPAKSRSETETRIAKVDPEVSPPPPWVIKSDMAIIAITFSCPVFWRQHPVLSSINRVFRIVGASLR
jgi:hypothetical protein